MKWIHFGIYVWYSTYKLRSMRIESTDPRRRTSSSTFASLLLCQPSTFNRRQNLSNSTIFIVVVLHKLPIFSTIHSYHQTRIHVPTCPCAGLLAIHFLPVPICIAKAQNIKLEEREASVVSRDSPQTRHPSMWFFAARKHIIPAFILL